MSQQQLIDKLESAGINATAQRIAVCRYVFCEADHPTADDVKVWADRNFPKMSLATVYNTLNTLVEAGLLRELRLPHSESAVYDCNTSVHHHFLDEDSGRLIDLDENDLEISLKLKRQFKVRQIEVLLKGTRS